MSHKEQQQERAKAIQAEAGATAQEQKQNSGQADVQALAETPSSANGKRITLQFIIFGLVGVLNTVVDLVVYWLLLQLSVYYVLANILSYGAGMLNSYIWNNNVTFRSRAASDTGGGKSRSSATIWRFVIWNGITLLLSSVIITVLIELVGWSELWSKLIATVIIVVVQFTGMKKWVFRE